MSSCFSRSRISSSTRRRKRGEGTLEREAGFTILELLIALTLLAALSALLFGGLRLGTRAWERSEATASQTDEIAAAQSFLRRELADAYPRLTTADPTRSRVYFEGARDSLQFLAPALPLLAPGGKGRFALMAANRSGRNELRVVSRFELAREEATSALTDGILVSGFERVEYGYFGTDRPQEPSSWQDDWAERGTLPELVRIRVKFASSDPRVWPDLVIAPRLTVDANCLYDPVTRRCRGR